MAQVKLHNVVKRYGPQEVVHGLDLTIKDGEFVVFVGPSGCGKSTLLRVVAGLILPTRGSVRIGATAVDGPRFDVGIVFQSPTLLGWRRILQNVLFPLEILGRKTARSNEQAAELLRLVGLAGFEQKRPHELSGGMQQRAAICRALVHDPGILLMDEPFGALDALTREEMSLELLRIWASTLKTILFVTHSVSEAVLLADRVIVMTPRPGRIADIVDVHLSRPRDYEQESSDEFHRCTQRIRQQIFGHRRGGGSAPALETPVAPVF